MRGAIPELHHTPSWRAYVPYLLVLHRHPPTF